MLLLLLITQVVALGEFLAVCPVSHYLNDDPIVFPGSGEPDGSGATQVNRSHLHTFLGNSGVTANTYSTSQLLNSSTTCNPAADRSSYWLPSLLNANGSIVPISAVRIYYQNLDFDPASVQPLPNGLKIIAGNARATGPSVPRRVSWNCQGAGSASSLIPQCDPGHPLQCLINFPECWDGVNLDSPDHKSHMAYKIGDACPGSHPVKVVRLQYKITYDAYGSGFRLSSGSDYSLHADAWIAWADGAQHARVNLCIHEDRKCGVLV